MAPNDPWDRLDAATQDALDKLIDEVKAKGAFIVKPWRGGDIYAYPHEDGGVSGGFQTSISSGGFCVARGVKRN